MKKFFGIVLALITLTAVFAFGNEMAGLKGGLSAVGIGTYVVSHFSTSGFSGLAFAVGVVRPLKRGKSNLAGVVKAVVFREDQFEPGANWPFRGKGELDGEIPLLEGEVGREWNFDKGSAQGTYTKSGRVTNQSYIHNFNGRASGWSQEAMDAFDDSYNVGLIFVGYHYDGSIFVYGSTRAPIMLNDTGDTQTLPESENGLGVSFTGASEVGCDHPPRRLASSVTVPVAAFVPYPEDEEEEEPETP